METLQHKLYECNYAKRIWDLVLDLTSALRTSNSNNEEKCDLVIGAVNGTTPELLTVHAEIISRLLYIKEDQNYLLRPKIFVKLALEFLARREIKRETRDKIWDLLNRYHDGV